MAESAPIRPEEKVKRKQWLGKLFARKKSKEENPAPLTKEQPPCLHPPNRVNNRLHFLRVYKLQIVFPLPWQL